MIVEITPPFQKWEYPCYKKDEKKEFIFHSYLPSQKEMTVKSFAKPTDEGINHYQIIHIRV